MVAEVYTAWVKGEDISPKILRQYESFYGPPFPERDLETNYTQLWRGLTAMVEDTGGDDNEAEDEPVAENANRELPEPLRESAEFSMEQLRKWARSTASTSTLLTPTDSGIVYL